MSAPTLPNILENHVAIASRTGSGSFSMCTPIAICDALDAAAIRGSEFSLKTRITFSITHINGYSVI